ncbi:hypothetical protein RFI_10335 [Reticulomyxa filosa]|uniref:Uncharacterized protein n=1 Tax=Reticulomyxa filosa TaxID=46433 RepID=X6NLD9_RETFI|nr:hypothetical protein RFI_10335 [Reticulomyxa filosa]|eukprot:ETO26801.1 hypothetical protein RFI_10335 [Reticulomyxa filosa]
MKCFAKSSTLKHSQIWLRHASLCSSALSDNLSQTSHDMSSKEEEHPEGITESQEIWYTLKLLQNNRFRATVLYNYSMKKCLELGDTSMVKEMMEDMERRNISQTEETYVLYLKSVMTSTIEKQKGAYELLETIKQIIELEMMKKGNDIQLTALTANVLIEWVGSHFRSMSLEQYQKATEDVVDLLQQWQVFPNIRTLQELMHMFSFCNDGAKVWSLLKKTKELLFLNQFESTELHHRLDIHDIVSVIECIHQVHPCLLHFKMNGLGATSNIANENDIVSDEELYQMEIIPLVEEIFEKSIYLFELKPCPKLIYVTMAIMCYGGNWEHISSFFDSHIVKLHKPMYEIILYNCLDILLGKFDFVTLDLDKSATKSLNIDHLVCLFHFVEKCLQVNFRIEEEHHVYKYCNIIKYIAHNLDMYDPQLDYILKSLPGQLLHLNLEHRYNRIQEKHNLASCYFMKDVLVPILQGVLRIEAANNDEKPLGCELLAHWLKGHHIQQYLWPRGDMSVLDMSQWGGNLELKFVIIHSILTVCKSDLLLSGTRQLQVHLCKVSTLQSDDIAQLEKSLNACFPHLKIDKITSHDKDGFIIDLKDL